MIETCIFFEEGKNFECKFLQISFAINITPDNDLGFGIL
jgi:hypothetical protein